MDALDAQIRQVFFFDTPDLALDRHGVVVRARRIQRKGGDAIVKLRPVEPAELPTALRASQRFTVEVDAVPGGFVCSGTMKRAVDSADVRAGRCRRAAAHVASVEAATRTRRGARTGWPGAGRPARTRTDPRAEAAVRARGARPAPGRASCGSTRTARAFSSCRPSASPARPSRWRRSSGRTSPAQGVDTSGDQETKTKKALQFFAAAITAEDGRDEQGGADC